MDKILQTVLSGGVTLLKGALIVLLLISVMISLVRQRSRRLAHARARKALPPA